MTYKEALVKLKSYGQEHLLAFYDDLAEAGKNRLLDQIQALDAGRINRLYQELVLDRTLEIEDELSSMKSETLADLPADERQRLFDIGLSAISRGEVCAFLVAGGQGSRLGFEGPKGAYDIGLPSHKSLFQLQGERLKNISDRAGFSIPWYIMTSPLNHQDTVNFFKDHHYFGLDPASLNFFPQGTLPSVDESGRILLAEPDQISANPDGSGGCFRAFKESGLLDDVTRRGIKYIFFYGVDNALVRVCDPYFIGFAIDQDKDIACKAVKKIHPAEKVGVYAYRNGKPSIIEYTELPKELAEATDEKNELLYGSANVVTHVIKESFLTRVLEQDPPYHVAHKKVDYIDGSGQKIKPVSPNAYKFEALYFDLFKFADDLSILNVAREEEFSPVKNFDGVDSKDTAREMFLALCTGWVEDLGIQTSKSFEISPLLSIYGDDLDKAEMINLVSQTTSGYIAPPQREQ